MSRQANIHGGGAGTNANGLSFEQTTDLNCALSNAGYDVSGQIVSLGGIKIGLSVQKYKFYKCFLEPYGIEFTDYNSKRWLPDECFINLKTKTVYIIEKKFQNSSGSVDEKLPGCDFKKKEYEKLCQPIGYTVEYFYVFNDWFKRKEYKDTLEYIKTVGCNYFYNEIPLNYLGL